MYRRWLYYQDRALGESVGRQNMRAFKCEASSAVYESAVDQMQFVLVLVPASISRCFQRTFFK